MRALINATGYCSDLEPFIKYRPSPMLHILDQPIIYYAVDFLLKQDIRQVDFILSHLPYHIENYFEKGSQLGLDIRYHLTPDPDKPYRLMKIISEGWEDEPFLLGRGDELPKFEFPWLLEVYKKDYQPTLLYYPDHEWSGWALATSQIFQHTEQETDDKMFQEGLKSLPHQAVKAKRFMEAKNLNNLKSINMALLKDDHSYHMLPKSAHMTQKGVWISTGSVVHPSVKITPPVYIGEHCQIKENASIGPNLVLEKNCVVENETVLENSLVLQQSHLGKGLHVDNCIVDRHYLYNLKLNTHILINDDVILSELKPQLTWEQIAVNYLEKGLALLFILLFSPILIYLLMTRHLQKKEAVSLPAGIDIKLWKTFQLYLMPPDDDPEDRCFFSSIPMLFNILQGNLHWIGTPPRSKKEINLLPPEWRSVYMQSKPGLITIEMVDLPTNPTSYEKFSAEAYYTSNMSLTKDLWLAVRWIFKSLIDGFKRIFVQVSDTTQ